MSAFALPTSFSAGPSSIANEPISGNSLDQFTRSTTNSLANTGQQAQQTGFGTTQAGSAGLGNSYNDLHPVLQHYLSLLSGDPNQMSSATAPEISQVNKGFQQAQQTNATLNPRGGGASGFMAQLPFMQQGAVNNILQTARQGAAQGATQTAGTQAGIAGELARTGQAQFNAGGGLLGQALQSQLERRGQNLGERGQNMGLATQLIRTGFGG